MEEKILFLPLLAVLTILVLKESDSPGKAESGPRGLTKMIVVLVPLTLISSAFYCFSAGWFYDTLSDPTQSYTNPGGRILLLGLILLVLTCIVLLTARIWRRLADRLGLSKKSRILSAALLFTLYAGCAFVLSAYIGMLLV